MGDRLSKLIQRFTTYISVPWRSVLSAEERAVFVVYHKEDELKLRARVCEFEIAATQHGHRWQLLDITNGFAQWMGEQDYKEAYFDDPELLLANYEFFAEELAQRLRAEIDPTLGSNDIVAILGDQQPAGRDPCGEDRGVGRFIVRQPGPVSSEKPAR